MRSALIWTVCVALSLMLPAPTSAQDPAPPTEGVLNLFFDCQGGGRACRDLDFLRREIPVVNWVRDREVSDLHVLVTSQRTGGGGRLYTMAFIGKGAFLDEEQTLTVATAGDATDDEERAALAGRLKLGLVRYLVGTAAADEIEVSMGGGSASGPDGAAEQGGAGPSADATADPWNFWVFQLRGNGFAAGESTQSRSNYSATVSANRTTDAWKFDLRGRYSRNVSEFQLSNGDRVESLIEDWSTTSLLVKSLSAQWSVGARTDAGRSTRRNEEFRWSVSPGVEYNFVPYSESSRRSITLQALLNVRHWDYVEQTIYDELSETRVAPSLTLAVNQIQPWGSLRADVTGSQYLHDRALRRLSVGGRTEVRVFRGFSINVSGNYAWVRDQLFPSAGGATTEEILLQQRSLETSFSYFTSFGISYRFGSIFNNVVNPRFGGSGREFFF